MKKLALILLPLWTSGCLEAPTLTEDTGAEEHQTVDEGGIWSTTIDATSDSEWVDFRPEEDGPWVLRFQRMNVALNGGISGDLGYEAIDLDTALEDVVDLADQGWFTDKEGPEGEVQYALDTWYDYDVSNHTLTPRPVTWALRAPDQPTYLVAFESYYDNAGTPAMISFRWMTLE